MNRSPRIIGEPDKSFKKYRNSITDSKKMIKNIDNILELMLTFK